MKSAHVFTILIMLFTAACMFGCKDDPGGPPPKYHTEENAGIWTDIIDSHVPQVRRLEGNRIEVRVTFSPTLKPLHYVEAIVLMKGEKKVIAEKKFRPSVSIPVAEFELPDSDEDYWVISKCNLHDMWRAEVK